MIRLLCLLGMVVFGVNGSPQREVRDPGAPRTPLVAGPSILCVDSIEDQAGGPCLRASSVPGPGLLFPPPHDGGVNTVVSGAYAFVGGGLSNQATNALAVIGGGLYNQAMGQGATIGGGTGNMAVGLESSIGGGYVNTAGTRCFVGGGDNNRAQADVATVGGGSYNDCSGIGSFIGGGAYNFVSGGYASIAGGSRNTASGGYASIAGGANNTASGTLSSVPGGDSNEALGAYGFAAGRRARAAHNGSFVWGDSGTAVKASSASDQFNVYASGGARIFSNSTATSGVMLAPGGGSWSSVSDRDSKENVAPVDARQVLERVRTLAVATWNYKTQDEHIRHMGPMAQDFHAAFGLGISPELIDTIDPDGVALAAIQGLDALVKDALAEKDAEIAALQRRLAALEARLAEGVGSAH